MIYSSSRFTLDIQKLHSQVSVPVALGDTAKTFYITLKDGAEPYFIETGCLAMLSIKRPSGTYLQAFCTILDNTVIKYDFSENENTAIEEGLHNCDVTLYNTDGEQLSSSWFTMVVNARVINSDDVNLTDEDLTAIDAMIAAEAARQEAEASRVNAESERVTAESGRVDAETARSSAFEELVKAAEEEEEARNTAFDELVEATKKEVSEALAYLEPAVAEVTLLASEWEGTASPYSQVVELANVSELSKVDLQPSVEQLAIFHDKDLAFVTENDNGVVTVYAIGDKPTNDYTIQATITEVRV